MDIPVVLYIIKFSLITALLNLENKNILSIGISYPIIAGAIIGYLMNNLFFGILTGCIIDLILVNLQPVGGSLPPNATIITGVVLTISHYFHIDKTGTLFPAVLIYGFFCGYIMKRISGMISKKDTQLVERFLKDVQDMKFRFFRYNLAGIVLDFSVFFLMTCLVNFAGFFLFKTVIPVFYNSFFIHSIFDNAYYYLPLLALLFVIDSFDVQKKIYYILAGVAAGFLMDLFIIYPILIISLMAIVCFIIFYFSHSYKERFHEL